MVSYHELSKNLSATRLTHTAKYKMAANQEEWRLCAEWLVRCKILASDHRVTWPTAEVFDLAQTLRDGVLICHLLNALKAGVIDTKDFSQRPQMSQVCTISWFHFCLSVAASL